MSNRRDSQRSFGAERQKPEATPASPASLAPIWDSVAIVLGVFFTFAGIMHFAAPNFFDAIVPPWLWPSERFWTYASGIAELIVGPLVLLRRTRRCGALAAIALLVAVYPANLYMVWDWRDRAAGEQIVSWLRLPFQFVFLWAAWMVAKRAAAVGAGSSKVRV